MAGSYEHSYESLGCVKYRISQLTDRVLVLPELRPMEFKPYFVIFHRTVL
jgi:hypothetical protein